MTKLLIAESTLVDFQDDRGGVHVERGTLQDVPKATAIGLVQVGRAFFADKKDDYDKSGRNTAPAEVIKAAAVRTAEIAKATDAATKTEK